MRPHPFLLASCLFFSSFPAFADTVPPDIVRKKDGGILRGTIEEMDPKGEVKITLPSGEKRSLSMGDVDYAGPAGDAPKRTAPAADLKPQIVVNAGEASLRLESPKPDVTFHVKTGAASVTSGRGVASISAFDRLCTAPCGAKLAAGSYTFGLSLPDGRVIAAPAVTVSGSSTLRGTFTSYAGIRVAGGFIGLSSLVLGGYLMFSGIGKGTDPDAGDPTSVYVGLGLMSIGTTVGVLMLLKSDEATVEVVPGVEGSKEARSTKLAISAPPSTSLQGLSLRASF